MGYSQQYYQISGDTSGTLGANSPYLAVGNLSVTTGCTLTIQSGTRIVFHCDFEIPNTSTLIIEEGCTLEFSGFWYVVNDIVYYAGTRLLVDGELQANGTSGSPIVFTKSSDLDVIGWGGILFDGTSNSNTSNMDYCVVENVVKGLRDTNNMRYDAGALYIRDFDNLTVNKSIFQNNSTHYGGALYITNVSDDLKFNDCTFHENTALYSGGAAYLVSDANPVFKTCIFEKNEALTDDGGAVFINNSDPLFESNCEFNENIAERHGGAVAVINNGQPEFEKSTLF